MKKSKIYINVLLASIIIFCILIFSLIITTCNHYFNNYIFYKEQVSIWQEETVKNEMISYMNSYYNEFLKFLFAVIFSALGAIASAVTAVIFNLRTAKLEELKKD